MSQSVESQVISQAVILSPEAILVVPFDNPDMPYAWPMVYVDRPDPTLTETARAILDHHDVTVLPVAVKYVRVKTEDAISTTRRNIVAICARDVWELTAIQKLLHDSPCFPMPHTLLLSREEMTRKCVWLKTDLIDTYTATDLL